MSSGSFISIPMAILVCVLFLLVPSSESAVSRLGNAQRVAASAEVKCAEDQAAAAAPPAKQRTWCIAKPSASYQELIDNLGYACNLVNCSAALMQSESAACYYPNTLINHASFAMNLYYHTAGANPWNCDFKNSALISLTDPSYAQCNFISL
ncbi:unnamed protein product [Cuscuta epithymum]|uniref:X8 domain-containing protein n=1 Tax=Cuscuta epithymum TaxID=186058 RepID=A0AAV0G0R4_9ASTE|nr:unnamed protein product [Cuscuta epithymum]